MSSGNESSPATDLPFACERIDFADRRILVMGLGLSGGGVVAARWLARQGARVMVTDLRPETALTESIRSLDGFDIEFSLGGHRERDFRKAEVVIVSPAVPLESPWLRMAPVLETEMNIFFKECRARQIIGVTGSNGKTTTCALTHEVLRRLGRSWLGGNIGRSMLEDLDRIGPDDFVTLEISSFQLEHLGAIRRSPNIAVVTNLTPNHLDRHGTIEAYAEAKRQIVAHQGPGDVRILNVGLRTFAGRGVKILFGEGGDVTFDGRSIHVGSMKIDIDGRILPGDFNVENMLAAAAATFAVAEDPGWAEAAREAFTTFKGVEHRLEYVGEVEGVRFYNDSIATNPESTLAALRALPGPLLMILGGYDKKLPFDALGPAMEGVKFAALMGETADAIDAVLNGVTRERVKDLEGAVRACFKRAREGDTIVLSPACASFDLFRNFAERGHRFKSIVRKLAV